MSIIDFHHHFPFGNDLDSYLSMLYRNNVERALVMPYDFLDLPEKNVLSYALSQVKPKVYIDFLKCLDVVNSRFLDSVNNFSDLVPACWFSPECSNLDSFILKTKVAKFIPVLDNFTPDYYSRINSLVEKLVYNNIIVMIHTGWGVSPGPVGKLASEFPKGKFVIAHMKEDNDLYALERFNALKNNSNLYCEISYFPHSKRISQYVNADLGSRLLFGSDYRTREDEQSLRGYIAMLNEADISDEVKKRILYDNAKSLLSF